MAAWIEFFSLSEIGNQGKTLPGATKVLRMGGRNCPYCGRSFDIYLSKPKSILESLALLVLFRPARCYDCMRRFLRPIFIRTFVRGSDTLGNEKPSGLVD
jgi:hypothetical protein